jgi:hypothetical protein
VQLQHFRPLWFGQTGYKIIDLVLYVHNSFPPPNN